MPGFQCLRFVHVPVENRRKCRDFGQIDARARPGDAGRALVIPDGSFYRWGLKLSFRLTARLNTSRPGLLSFLSAQK